jgi:hypothetical protein
MGAGAAKAKRAATGETAQLLARAGLVAKGISFGLVGVLAFGVAFGIGQKVEDRPGALQTLAESTLGRFLLGALAVGLGSYALWRFAQAALGEKLESGEDVNFFKRIGLVARGLLYAWFFVMCISIFFNADEPVTGGGSGSRNEDRATAFLLEQPLGRWLVAAVELGIIGAGLFNLYRGLTQRFRKDLKEEQMEKEERKSYAAIGVVGHLARALLRRLVPDQGGVGIRPEGGDWPRRRLTEAGRGGLRRRPARHDGRGACSPTACSASSRRVTEPSDAVAAAARPGAA